MWDLILTPMVIIMIVMYQVLGNNVVLAITGLTLLIRVLTFPLLQQQQQSSKGMQAIQPEIKKLQEKYKNDREKLAQAQMELFRENRVNPLAGCLPLLIQLPVLIAVYQAIQYALAATPMQLMGLSSRLPSWLGLDALLPLDKIWFGMDLTQPPNFVQWWSYLLPLLVFVTTWYQTRLTMPSTPQPTTTADGQPDPTAAATQSMTTMMPIMFGFFALSYSLGLSVYFIVSNVLGILQYKLFPTNTTPTATTDPNEALAKSTKAAKPDLVAATASANGDKDKRKGK
jgi:YidC/Oxa1 family membrane protein insertase